MGGLTRCRQLGSSSRREHVNVSNSQILIFFKMAERGLKKGQKERETEKKKGKKKGMTKDLRVERKN